MHHTVAQELGVVQGGYHRENALLLAELKIRLEADEVVHGAVGVLLAKLQHCPRAVTRARIAQTDRLHGAEAHGIPAALSHDLDRHTALVDLGVHHVELVHRSSLCVDQSLVESLVFFLVHRAVEIILSPALAVARLEERVLHIDRLRRNYRSRRIEEAQALAVFCGYIARQRLVSKRPRCDDDDALIGYPLDLLMHDLDQGVGEDRVGNHRREELAVDSQGSACRHGAFIGALQKQRAEGAHLFLQQARGGIHAVSLEGVGADDLAQLIRMMRRAELFGLAVDQSDRYAAP